MNGTLPDPILLTGCARSGTSMTAGILKICGVYGGKMSGPTRFNKKGMFENSEIREQIVKPYLDFLGVDRLGQKPLPDVNNLKPHAGLRRRVETAMKFQGYRKGLYFYKGAKLCLIHPVWNKAFPGAKWIIVRRKDEDIINSCMRTGFMRAYNTEAGWQTWVDHHKERFVEMLSNPNMNVVEVYPTKFIEGDFSEIEQVINKLGLKWREDQVKEFINPALWSKK